MPRVHSSAMKNLACVSALALACAAGCAGRTSAATQPTPAAFDAKASDPAAVKIVDQMVAALGGAKAWDGVKQIQWTQKVFHGDKLQSWVTHSWDRWNGRHRAELTVVASYEKAMAEGKPELIQRGVAMYDLFDHGHGTVLYRGQQVSSADEAKWIERAYKAWKDDSYRLAAYYKMENPGVILKSSGQADPVEGHCEPKCDVIKVTFAPEVGTDTYYLNINTQTHMPEIIAKQMGTGSGRLAYGMSGWVTVSGLKFATEFQNLGLKTEIIRLSDLRIGEPDDTLYIPQVQ